MKTRFNPSAIIYRGGTTGPFIKNPVFYFNVKYILKNL